MIALSLSLGFLGLLAFIAYRLWLKEGQHLLTDIRRELSKLDERHAREVSALGQSVDAAVAEVKAEGAAIRSEMNQLAAAVGLSRRDGSPFANRGQKPAEVLR